MARLCDSVGDAQTLRLELLAEFSRVIGFDAYVWLLTDPETSVGSSPLAESPCMQELPSLILLKYLTGVNRWTTLNTPVALLARATDGDLMRSLLWRDLLVRYGVVDVASSVFADRFGCWGFLDLWRIDPAPGFSDADAAYLAGIAEPVTRALRRTQANTFLAPAKGEPQQRGPVVLLLSDHLEVLAETPATQDYLRVLVPPSEGQRSPVPASAYNVAAQLLAVEAEVDQNQPSARVHLSDGVWLTLRAARIGSVGSPPERAIAVTIEETSPTDRAALFASAFGLSPREGELLRHLVAGSDTRDLAHQMSLSEHTVQDHLKSIFAKTSVHNRPTLLARALGT